MARLATLKPRVATVASRLKAATTETSTFGQGRGGRPWRRLRDQILQRDGYLCQCEQCQQGDAMPAVANEVDHIVPRAWGGTDDPSNLRAINDVHHRAKTAREANGR